MKDGCLRHCIEYQGLNQITAAYPHRLHLVPVSLEQLREASVSTELDARSASDLNTLKIFIFQTLRPTLSKFIRFCLDYLTCK